MMRRASDNITPLREMLRGPTTQGAPAPLTRPGAGRPQEVDVAEDSPAPTSVYRYYDRLGVLIYVGITSRAIRRQREHNDAKEWWAFVMRQEVDHYPSRGAALDRERELIRAHRPPFNRQHNPGWEQTRAAYLAFASAVPLFDPDDTVAQAYKKLKDAGGVPLIPAAYNAESCAAYFISEPIHPALLAGFHRNKDHVIFYNRNGTRLGGALGIKVADAVLLVEVALRRNAPAAVGQVVAQVRYDTATKPAQFRVTALRETSAPLIEQDVA